MNRPAMLNNVRDPCIVADDRIVLSDMVKHRHDQPKTFLHRMPASLPVCAECLACWFLPRCGDASEINHACHA
ncbi:hypothetical protein D1605_004495 [Xylella fastidiosa subsp. fastidiosa]|uniref:Uncharacterized protein n=2 Tax=Xylella fastidiosa TaxID=2371 RepID=Q87D52_XYLFT|nr:conserved hypothetical protein [Xylella fastidiosa Temecula1]MBE0262122.1 hypothetical protein [Xylella fastidiosa subsp. fastidiosa]NMR00264.1 hypothetical protein [Xylella fastidiosa]MBE0263967.1 hypothetical protein [Xylella fastidiosa subsp. fastidiosa]MBE0266176.1 hypothetical protein [Xylella fastidiosa subsp. fastidiosa]